MKKPIIGVVEWPYQDQDGDYIYEVINPVIEKISKHGGIPIGIFPTQIEKFQETRLRYIKDLTNSEKEDLNTSIEMCDAIIKPGALKIYGYERYIYDYVFKKDMPYIGICAGMQLMASYNKKIENVKNEDLGVEHKSKEEYVHKLKILKETLLYEILKKEEIMVNSKHGYHISNPGIHKCSAYSEDGLIEAIENREKKFNIGFQWHPELLNDENTDKIFDRFLDEAEKYNFQKTKK